MLSPQRAVAAASGGAGEAPNFPRTRFTATPDALRARARRRPPVRAAVPPCPGAARPSPGSLARDFGAGSCSQGRVGRARAAPYSAHGWSRLLGSGPAPGGGR